MGGQGSGSWYRYDTKSTVEESNVFAMKDIRKSLIVRWAGTMTWTSSGGYKSSIGYYVTGTEAWPSITLHYRWHDKEDVSIPIRLESTPTQFGGRRWWFTCPLIVRGIACKRRSGKLYLPPGAKYFGCRRCYELTYQSCQEAHHTERAFARMGFDADAARIWDRTRRRK